MTSGFTSSTTKDKKKKTKNKTQKKKNPTQGSLKQLNE